MISNPHELEGLDVDDETIDVASNGQGASLSEVICFIFLLFFFRKHSASDFVENFQSNRCALGCEPTGISDSR